MINLNDIVTLANSKGWNLLNTNTATCGDIFSLCSKRGSLPDSKEYVVHRVIDTGENGLCFEQGDYVNDIDYANEILIKRSGVSYE